MPGPEANRLMSFCDTGNPLGVRQTFARPGCPGSAGTLSRALGKPELANDPRFDTNRSRMENVAALKEALESTLTTHDTDYWLRKFNLAGVPCGPLNTVEQAVKNPQVQSRNMVVEIDDDRARRLKIAGNPIKLSRYPDPDTRGPAPTLNQHRYIFDNDS